MILACGAQLWAIKHFDQPNSPALPIEERQTEFREFPGSLDSDQLAQYLLARDPTLFALPGAHGFTGPVWLAATPVDHHAPVWTEPPRFLEMDPGSLGRTLSTFLHDNGFPPFDSFDKAPPSRAALGLFPPFQASENRSTLSIEGDLKGRPLENTPVLLAWPANDVPADTVVRVGVNGSGTIISAVLTDRSGLPAADAEALRLARQLRFRPATTGPAKDRPSPSLLTWGDLVFSWAVSPSTNPPTPPATPPRGS